MNMVRLFFLLLIVAPGSLLAQEGPKARGSFPRGGAEAIIRNAFISVLIDGGPLDSASVNPRSVKLYPTGNPQQAVPAFVLYREDLRNITLEPYGLLLPKTSYTFEISDAVTARDGAPFQPYVATFSTGEKALRKMITMNKSESFGSPPGVIGEDPEPYVDVDAMIAQAEAAWEAEQRETRKTLPALTMVRVPDPKRTAVPPVGQNILVNPTEPTPITLPDVKERETIDLDEIAMRPIRIREDAFMLENDLMPLYLPRIEQVALLPQYADPMLYMVLGDVPDEEELPSDEDLAMGLAPGEDEATVVTPGLSPAGKIYFEKGSRVRLGQKLEITFDFEMDEYVTMKLRTYDGDIKLTESGWVYPGRRTRAVLINGIPPGTYYAVFESESFKTTRKVVVER